LVLGWSLQGTAKAASISSTQHVLEAYSFTSARRKELQEQIETWEGSLLEQHYRNLLKQSGLTGVVEALKTRDQAQGDVSRRFWCQSDFTCG
jgi:hypothetical protein